MIRDASATQEPVIRQAAETDARGISEVHISSWKAAYTGLIPQEQIDQLDLDRREQGWRQLLRQSNERTEAQRRGWVAVVNGRIVGFAVTQAATEDDLDTSTHELSALYLEPAVWRLKIGTGLLGAAEKALREVGIPTAILWVLEANDAATRFYEAQGWTPDRRDPSFRVFGVPAVRYRKQL